MVTTVDGSKSTGHRLDVLRDTIQPFPTFSEIYIAALKALHGQIATKRQPSNAGSSPTYT
jgi:hypothetical protein